MTMARWIERLDAFLEFNDREVLTHAGNVQKAVADRLALERFDRFSAEQRHLESTQPTSDFDRFVDDIKNHKPSQE